MRKVDSFLKEVMRYYALGPVGLTRKVLKDDALADGTFLPAGTFVSAAPSATLHDEELYQRHI